MTSCEGGSSCYGDCKVEGTDDRKKKKWKARKLVGLFIHFCWVDVENVH